jgi:hypothetical protein
MFTDATNQPPLEVTATCRSCGAPIVWATHVRTGKRAPLDASPSATGFIELEPLARTYRILGDWEREQLAAHLGRVPLLYTNHFAICPQAGRFRGKRGVGDGE